MRRTTLFMILQVLPHEVMNQQGEVEEDGKQLVFQDPDTNETLLYPMTKDFAQEIARQLKMSNKSLEAHHMEKQRQAQAQALLRGGNGAPAPGEDKIVGNILKGVHRREDGT